MCHAPNTIKVGERMVMEAPSYIKSLLTPNGRKPAGRKVWSVDLETVWLPFFTATNTEGNTRIPHDALGAPLRLGYNPDGSVKFSKAGRPITKVAKELGEMVRMVRENFSAGLQEYAHTVITENEAGYTAQVEMAQLAGEPIMLKDRASLEHAQAVAMAEAIAEAECNAEAEAKAEAKANKDKVPVTA